MGCRPGRRPGRLGRGCHVVPIAVEMNTSLWQERVMRTDRTVSRFTFWLTVFLGVVMLAEAEIILASVIYQRLGLVRERGAMVGGLAFPNYLFARIFADRFFNRLGLSRSGRMV